MTLFLATYLNKIDQKGRVSIPASFRAVLSGKAETPPTEVIVFKSLQSPALDACSLGYLEQLSAALENPDMPDDLREAIETTVFGGSVRLPIDPEGRIIIPKGFVDFAGITGGISFVGRRKTFQLWDPERFEAHEATSRAEAKANNISLSTILARTNSLARGNA